MYDELFKVKIKKTNYYDLKTILSFVLLCTINAVLRVLI